MLRRATTAADAGMNRLVWIFAYMVVIWSVLIGLWYAAKP